MTGRSTPYVVCDYQDAPTCWSLAPERHPATVGAPGEQYPTIRRRLAGQGWTRPSGVLDRCPSCSRADAAALRGGEGVRS